MGVVTTSKMCFLLSVDLWQPGLPDVLTPHFKVTEKDYYFFVLLLLAVVVKHGPYLTVTF